MAWHDRPYNNESHGYGSYSGGGGMGGRLAGATVVVWLMGITAAVFVLDNILTSSTRGGGFSPWWWGYFSVERGVYGLQVWRWVTYLFLHDNLFHIVFNMFGLYFFGPDMERWWGGRRFLAFYIACGLAAAMTYTALSFIPGLLNVGPGTGLIGASGSIYGTLLACAALYPNRRVMLLFPPIPMSLRTMAFVFVGISMFSLIAGSNNAGGEAAHLGGALMGVLLVRNPRWLGFIDGADIGGLQKTLRRRRNRKAEREDAQIDQILVKVREHGLASLTSREKKLLQRATDRQRRAE